jgi:hypothetical protein
MKNHIPTFEDFVNESAQNKTLDDPKIKTADVHKWIVNRKYEVAKKFPATNAKTKEDKVAIIMDPAFQKAYIDHHQSYFNDLQKQWQGVCDKNLSSRGVTKISTKEYVDDIFDALEQWLSRENGILTAIKDLGFESYVANEITGEFYKKPLNLKRKY